jgi:outer membrane protein assembly factor BamB
VCGLALALLLTTAGAGVAATPSLKVSSVYVQPGGRDVVSGAGYRAGESVVISLDSTASATVTASSAGGFSKTVAIPQSTLPGNHTLHAVGQTSHLSASRLIAVEANWLQDRFGASRWGENPLENVVSAGSVSGLVLNWQTTGSGFIDHSSPSESDAVVFEVCKFAVCAYSQSTGTRIWRSAQTSGDAGSPAIGGGVVVITESSCFVSGGLCQHIRGLSQKTGAALWTKLIPESVDESPLLVGTTMYYDAGSAMHAIAVATGKPIWSATSTHGTYATAPAYGSGELVAPTDSGATMVALNPANGHVLWAVPSSAFAVTLPPLVAAGTVFAGGVAPSFSGFGAWNATTGASIWSTTSVDPTTPPAYDGAGIVYVGTDNGLVAFDATNGTVMWTADSGQSITASPTVANGVVYYGAGTTIVGANAATGATLWSQTTTSAVKNSPMVVNGRLFFTTDDGALHAYHL